MSDLSLQRKQAALATLAETASESATSLRVANGHGIPAQIVSLIRAGAGPDADLVLRELQETVSPTVPSTVITEGDWIFAAMPGPNQRDLRPDDAIKFSTIREMNKSGVVQFCREMKLARITQHFFDPESWGIDSPDRELVQVAEAALARILPRMMAEAGRSALENGAAFMETPWELLTKYQLGLSKSKAAGKSFAVPRLPAMVDPATIKHIDRTAASKFNGFTQRSRLSGRTEISVARDAALVLTYNGAYRNLWGRSFYEPLYPLWYWFEAILRAMVRYMQRQATPVAIGRAPMSRRVQVRGTNRQIDALDMIMAVAGNAARSSVIGVPSDRDPETGQYLYDVGYLVSEERSQPFISALETVFQFMQRTSIFADKDVGQAGGGGEFRLGEIRRDASQIHNGMVLGGWVGDLNEHWIPKFSLYNRGVNGPPIWLRVRPIDPGKADMLSKLLSIIGNSTEFQEIFYMIDWRTWAQQVGFSLLSEEEAAAFKARIDEEKLERQKKFMDAGLGPAGNKPGQSQPPSEPPSGRGQAQKNGQSDDQPVKQSHDDWIAALLVEQGLPTPLVLSRSEVDLILDRRGEEGPETVQLFNPFHDRLGKFASKSAAGGGSVSGTSAATGAGASRDAVLAAAGQNRGSFLKTTAQLLGLAAIGAVAVAAIGGAGGEGEEKITIKSGDDEYTIDENGNLIDKNGKIVSPGSSEENPNPADDHVIEIVSHAIEAGVDPLNVPAFSSPQEAGEWVKATLTEMGLDPDKDLLIPIKIVGENDWPNPLPDTSHASYFFDSNTIVLTNEAMRQIAEGDPFAMATIVHEFLHARQEDPGAILSAMPRSSYDFLEGQNELLTSVVMNRMFSTSGISHGGMVYHEQTSVAAAIAIAHERRTGQPAIDGLIATHDRGFVQSAQIGYLRAAFPEQMANYSGGGLPSMSTIRRWAEQEGIDPGDALNQILGE